MKSSSYSLGYIACMAVLLLSSCCRMEFIPETITEELMVCADTWIRCNQDPQADGTIKVDCGSASNCKKTEKRLVTHTIYHSVCK